MVKSLRPMTADGCHLSLVVWWLLKLLFGLRISAEDEYQGADISECGMEAYPEFSNKA
ncbi:hypothetical protein GCM10007878_13630 [Marinospirillum insulare]|uniref:Ammonium transporter AmtB-like domain-containing protein n=1 Tax=Marinospirillum insulare TaxID=217169 RepID=A0ABQ5ZUR0_9GAMM|nr:hypothetical protein GCM10007878_13630 [Marinospirillum insulare]